MNRKPVPMVVRSVPGPLQLLFMLLGASLWLLSQARVEFIDFARDGIFLMFDNLEDQESELLCPPNFVELRGLFLRWYFFLHLKFLHVALVELEGAIVGSLRVVRYRSLVIFRVLG